MHCINMQHPRDTHTQPSGFLFGLANRRPQKKGRRVSSGFLYSRLGFSKQEYWSGLPCPPPGDLPNPGIEPRSLAPQVDSLPSEPPGKPFSLWTCLKLTVSLSLFLRLKILLFFLSFFFFWSYYVTCGTLVPWPGIKPVSPAVDAQSPNHWPTREVPWLCLSQSTSCKILSPFRFLCLVPSLVSLSLQTPDSCTTALISTPV